jgi:hypothetical protein
MAISGWVAMLQQGGFLTDTKHRFIDYSKTLWDPALCKAFANGAPEQAEVAKIGQRMRHLLKQGCECRIGRLNTDLATWLSACKNIEVILAQPLMVKAQCYSERVPGYHLI